MKNTIKKIIRNIYRSVDDCIASHMRLSEIIFFESAPDLQDSARYVFEEMIRRGWNERYAMYWAVDHPENFKDYPVPNTFFIKKSSKEWKEMSRRSRVLLSCNCPFYKTVARKDQLFIHLGHGCAYKSCGSIVYAPRSMTYLNRMTLYNSEIEARSANIKIDKIIALGHARNDVFYRSIPLDLRSLFPDSDFDKLIMWLPTFRQNIAGTRIYSSISLPIIHNKEDAEQVNEIAKKANVLIVLKPHYNQNLKGIELYNFSNLKIVKDSYFSERDLTLYDVLSHSDAMITDYSSVLHDYLNANKPIGLCWEDFDEFNEREGFDVDIQPIREIGEMVNTMANMEKFIQHVSRGYDEKQEKRQQFNLLVNPYQDGRSGERMVDFIEQWILKNKKR